MFTNLNWTTSTDPPMQQMGPQGSMSGNVIFAPWLSSCKSRKQQAHADLSGLLPKACASVKLAHAFACLLGT